MFDREVHEESRGLDLGSVLPHVKAATAGPHRQQQRISDLTPVSRAFVGSLMTTYVIDIGAGLRFVSEQDLTGTAITVDELHQRAVRNFAELVAKQRVRMPKYHAITPVLYDGNFEVSLMFLDEVWAWFEAQFGEPAILAVAPARDIFAFCPASSAEGRTQLGELIDRVWPTADHPLTRDFYRRVDGAWQLDQP
ncbi:hypothetical protein [Micromonospora sp. NPDC050200]|uniref:hypothetical protein n=1 Tax=Micromonospora sp. NPDC050200 TaxID=3155664 RepID=UPI0033C39107